MNNTSKQEIVIAAIQLAEQSCWEQVRLFEVAKKLNISLAHIHHIFAEKEQISDAWFDMADGILLKAAEDDGFNGLAPQEQLHHCLMSWFYFLSQHHKVSCEMIKGKLEFGHIHMHALALWRTSRTVQWWREAVQRKQSFTQRAIDETLLTTIFLTTLMVWIRDTDPQLEKTAKFLQSRLANTETINKLFH